MRRKRRCLTIGAAPGTQNNMTPRGRRLGPEGLREGNHLQPPKKGSPLAGRTVDKSVPQGGEPRLQS
jgi:hypothetical protein